MQKTLIVIPCYNEESKLDVTAYTRFLRENPNIFYCFVNDGSSDGTISILKEIQNAQSKQVIIIDYATNRGKAEAVRQGVLESLKRPTKFDYLGYLDADLATPLNEILYLLQHMLKKESYQLSFGSRMEMTGNEIKTKFIRRQIGKVISVIFSAILELGIYDTQCGAKVFKRELSSEVFQQKFISRWLFDIEIFARMIKIYGRSKALTMFVEVPLNQWEDKGDSKVKYSYVFRMFYDLIRIKKTYKSYL